MQVRLGRFRIGIRDGGHLLFATLITGYIAWYVITTLMVARHTADLLLVLPAGLFMGLLYLFILWREIRIVRIDGDGAKAVGERAATDWTLLIKQWVYVAAMAAFILLIPVLGLEIAIIVFCLGMFHVLGSRNLLLNVTIAVCFSIAATFFFVGLMRVPIDTLLF